MDSMSKKKIAHGLDSDIISNLPDNITDEILVRLPIREAVRTCVLSTKWRYKWTAIPELDIDEHFLTDYTPNKHDEFVDFVDRVLLLHTGQIQKFSLSTSSVEHRWVFFLSNKNIKEFKLITCSEENYVLPSYFFLARQFRTLYLHRCVLEPPPTFAGFSNLKSLCLRKTTFVDKGGFECLVSKCTLLETLTLEILVDNLGHVNICFPNLKYLCLSGIFEDICFENTPLLSDVSIDLLDNITNETFEEFLRTETRNVVKVLSSLPSLRKFVVRSFFLKFLTLSKIPEKLPVTCHQLNNLSLHLNFEDVNEICVTLCLLNSSPNLRELEIKCRTFDKLLYDVENFWEERIHIDWNMSGLQVVKMTDFTGFELELKFIKLLLANSPMLEMLSIRYGKQDILDSEGLEVLKELLIFPCASPNAKIKFFERNSTLTLNAW